MFINKSAGLSIFFVVIYTLNYSFKDANVTGYSNKREATNYLEATKPGREGFTSGVDGTVCPEMCIQINRLTNQNMQTHLSNRYANGRFVTSH